MSQLHRIGTISRIALFTAALVAVGGCGDDTPKAASTSPAPTSSEVSETTVASTTSAVAALPNPCELLPIGAAEQLLPGATLLPGVEAGQGDNISCTYTGDPNGPTAQVEVFVGAGAKKSLDIDKDSLAHDFTQPPGIGDEAWLEADNIFLRKGTLWVQLRVVTLDLEPDQVAANLTAAAGTVAGML